MGTNYYARSKNAPPKCTECGHQPSGIDMHIGKSSFGWTYSLRVYPDDGITGLGTLIDRITALDLDIFDEYHKRIAIGEWLKVVLVRYTGGVNGATKDFMLKGGTVNGLSYDHHDFEFS
jgi:hypothetical protein